MFGLIQKYTTLMHFHVITLFPEPIKAYLSESVLGRSQAQGNFAVSYYDPREFTKDKHRNVDDRPYGGGPGMVMLAEPILKAWKKAVGRKTKVKTIIFSPGGTDFTNTLGQGWLEEYRHLVLISGRYEGVDDRVRQITNAEEVSIGDFVLTGGEVPAMAVIDAMARRIPGTLGSFDSIEESRAAGHRTYTRPPSLAWGKQHYDVPEVLVSGDHKKIDAWRISGGE